MNPSTSLRPVAAVVVALVASVLVAVPSPARAQSGFSTVQQLPASSFVDAGLAVSQLSFEPGVGAVVLATDANFPDGLTASAVAGAADGPVLFTAPDALDQGTAEEIDRLLEDGDTVYVMGGTDAISPAVTDALGAYAVIRVEGASRIETAVAAADVVGVPADGRVLLARAFGPDGAGTPSDRTTGWVDAIACGAYAAAEGLPIYLTQTDVLTGSTRDALAASTATDVTICGGEAAISTAVADELTALGLRVDRVSGVTRVETAIAAATGLFGLRDAAGGSYVVAPGYGESFGYGLAAAPLGLPILLVGATEPTDCADTSQPSRETLCYLQTATEEFPAQLLVIGDGTVIGDGVVDALGQASGGVDIGDLEELPAPTGVTATDDVDDDGTALSVSWDAVEDPDEILVGYNVYVDGELVGTEPTVPAGTTELELSDLTADEEVTVTVTALDRAGRESAMSQAATATPVDEAPEPVEDFLATPFDGQVRLSWERGPDDTESYTISRAPAGDMGSCTGVTYAQVTKITNPATLTFTDTGVTNGTAYCYRHVVADAADQTSEPNDQGPVTPAVPRLGITIINVDDEFTFHTGFPHEIRTTTTLDQTTTLAQLNLVIEFVPNACPATDQGCSYGDLDPLIIRDTPHPDTTDVVTPFRLVEGMAGGPDVTAYDDAVGSLRASVFVVGGNPVEDRAEDVEISRAPEQVMGLEATGGNGSVVLTWTASPEPTTTMYEIQRAVVAVTEQTDDPGVCNPQNPTVSYTTVERRPTTAGTTYTDSTVTNGNGFSDNRYCYRVRATRPAMTGLDAADQNGAFSLIDSANPDISMADLTIVAPSGGTVQERREAPVEWTITVPAGGTPTATTTLEYCVDYGANPLTGVDECRGTGFQPMDLVADDDNTVDTVVAAGQARTFTARWQVPSINQPDGATGAVRLRTQGGSDVNAGISFR